MRISVTGFIVYLMNDPICWRSKANSRIGRSKEIKFIFYLLQGIRIEIDRQIIVKANYIGAMYTVQNASSSERTSHVDTRYHYNRESVYDFL
jgi:hypothetical protein